MVKDVKLKKGMCRDEVNRLLKEHDVDLELVDEVYGGALELSNWKCKCERIFQRRWDVIRGDKISCEYCRLNIKNKYNSIDEVYIEKGMSKESVNKIIKKWILLEDSIYLGNSYNHNWKCLKCGITFKRRWTKIKSRKSILCENCRRGIKDEYTEIKEVKLIKGMKKSEVNNIISKWITLEDDIYLGNRYLHKWKCICGILFIRKWENIRMNCTKCNICRFDIKEKYANLKSVHIEKNMSKEKINQIISKWLYLEDDIYFGGKYKHNWRCKCGTIVRNRTWDSIKSIGTFMCDTCKYKKHEYRYKYEVEKDGEYEYIKSFRAGEILSNGRKANRVYLQIKHKYCGNIYEIEANNFIKVKQKCNKCCLTYENSFAYYIEKELGQPIEKYWDFEKNTLNPYNISKNTHKKVFIKCQEKDYHGSYIVSCDNFIDGKRCSYCNPSGNNPKVHFKDSFAQYCINNIDEKFLDTYWDYEKNTVNPFDIAPKNNTLKVWIKCQEKDYHGSYIVSCDNFIDGKRCSYCNPSGNNPKVHFKDSFGYNHFDKVISWHKDNIISPFKISPNSHRKIKFICHECGNIFEKQLKDVHRGQWCVVCSKSKGEKVIETWLIKNNIKYNYEEKFKNLIGLSGGSLSYDFYLQEYKLLIEYQGEFHDGSLLEVCQTEEQYKQQQEHDRRKREYAKNNGYKLLEIWYWNFDNIEEILDKEIGSLL
ncbi:TPA: hypothetical protein KR288_002399 [Clostridioides difficile]|nr:hypothetical protein [Clostridioides difficile]